MPGGTLLMLVNDWLTELNAAVTSLKVDVDRVPSAATVVRANVGPTQTLWVPSKLVVPPR